jgi:hypothetical protein
MIRTRDRWWIGALLWVLAVVLMFGTVVYQRRTGPTHPLQGTVGGEDYALIRSGTSGEDARVALPAQGEGVLHHRRYPTDDAYTATPMKAEGDELAGYLPTQPAAGKLEYYVELRGEAAVLVPPDVTAVIRFKDSVPAWALVPHILLMFVAVLVGIRTLLEALVGRRRVRGLSWTTFGCVALGGMVMGPIVQEYAFGAFWTGVPFGWDLTDNKTLVMFVGWLVAVALLGRRGEVSAWGRWGTVAAAAVMLAVYLVPHSMYGSELDYEAVDGGMDPEAAIGQG